jgi:hypothetical protein
MSRCVSDRTIWLISEGEAGGEAQAHVASCAHCTLRVRRLQAELHDLQVALSGVPPAVRSPTRLTGMHRYWLATGATLAALVMLAWVGGRWWFPTSPLVTELQPASMAAFMEGVSVALFTDAALNFGTTPDRLADFDDLQAALAWEWSCEGQASIASWACETETVALLLGEL